MCANVSEDKLSALRDQEGKKKKKTALCEIPTQWTPIRVIEGSMCFEVAMFQAALGLNRAQLSDLQPIHSSTGRDANPQTAITVMPISTLIVLE